MNELENAAMNAEPIPTEEPNREEVTPQQEETQNIPEETVFTEEEVSANPMPNYHGYDKKELLEALTKIVEEKRVRDHKEVGVIKQSFYSLRTRELDQELALFIESGNEPSAFAAKPDETETAFKEMLAEFRGLRNDFLEEEEKRRIANLEKKQEIIEKLKEIVADIDNVNLRYPEFSQLQNDFKAIKEVPVGTENNIWKTYQMVVEQFFDHLKMNKELRDLAFKKNLEAKKALIEEAKNLEEVDDVVEAARQLQDLHARWKDVGPVAKELRDSIWEEFRQLSSRINKRHQDYFTARKENESANEQAKKEIIAKMEAIDAPQLKRYKEWDEATEKVQALQGEWKSLGFASRKVNTQLFATFRQLCDAFFAAKAAFYKTIKEEHSANLAKKEELVAKVEALKDKEQDLNKCIDEIQKIREEWKTIGPVAKRMSDDVWKRFMAACDYYFEERKKRNKSVRKEESENLEKKLGLIEELKALPRDLDRKELLGKVREIQSRWNETGHVPFKKKDDVNGAYRAQCDELYDLIGTYESRNRMNNFERQVSQMRGDGSKMGKERERLYRMLEAKRNELKTVENNLGFFNVKSSAGNSMVKEIERRAEKIKGEIEELKKKIEMLDSAAE